MFGFEFEDLWTNTTTKTRFSQLHPPDPNAFLTLKTRTDTDQTQEPEKEDSLSYTQK